jgi:hypothetical protein
MGWLCCKDWRWRCVRESHLAKELSPSPLMIDLLKETPWLT